jgi:ribosomal protein S18 acetylase RimI-like enzyme
MAPFILRTFTPADIPAVTALQQAYQQVFPHTAVVPGQAYLSPGFDEGRNIFCAFDDSGILQGYAPFFPVLAEQPHQRHTFWTEVRVHPQLPSPGEVKDLLFEQVCRRAGETARAHPAHPARLAFQYHPSEIPSIDYILARGCTFSESVIRMSRDLSDEILPVPAPGGIDIHPWRMDSEAEQQAYIQARNESFPEAPITLADWQNFLASPEWEGGASMTAFEGGQVAGSVIAYWDEAVSRQVGHKIGFTEYIFVRPRWRGRGIAASLIARSLQYLKEHGREFASLEVKAVNVNALNLYYRLGYVKIDETKLYFMEV